MRSKAKKTTILASVILIVGSGVCAVLVSLGGIVALVGAACLTLTFGVAFLICAKVKCDACGTPLSKTFPVGSLLLLWLAKQNCRRCGASL